ncbi:MAG: UDP-N-acetylmuramoyl-L-alanyl-D-glutamate--2,6-diaminopimelate ligase [Cellvibrionaceae bacterium]
MMAKENTNTMPTLAQLFSGMVLNEPLQENTIASMPIAGITIDSREVDEGYLFVAIKGLQVHGKDFAEQAIKNGAAAILIDEEESLSLPATTVPVIRMEKMERQLSRVAGNFYAQPSYNLPVIGVTGTNGKTTCTQLLAQAFAYLDIPCGVMGTLGYGLVNKEKLEQNENLQDELVETGMTTTDPVTTQQICASLYESGANVLAMEVSSHGLSQHRVSDVFIRTAVFTNLSHDHLDYHGSMNEYGAAKAKLFDMSSVTSAVINLDDEFSARLIRQLRPDIQLVTYSVDRSDALSVAHSSASIAHFSVESIIASDKGIKATLLTPDGKFDFTTMLVGRFNISNLLAVVATLYVNRYALDSIVGILPKLKPVPGRMEIIPNQTGVQVVIDYAHTPDALKNALSALATHVEGKLWCVFGCGGDRDRKKRPQMAAIAEELADKVVLTSDNPRTESSVQIFADIEAGFSTPRDVIVDRASAIDFAISEAERGDVVLIAGKGHEDYQIIGKKHFPFSDHNEARLSLRRREQASEDGSEI